MRTIFERVTIGDRKYTIFEIETQHPSGRRRTWEVWAPAEGTKMLTKVFGPASRVKCYEYLNQARGD